MAVQMDSLTPAEAAFVAGVSLRDVHRMIDERILPERLFNTSDSRSFKSRACVYISFYVRTADRLTSEERQRTIGIASKATTNAHIVRDEFLTIDFGPFSKSVGERMKRLQAARDTVVSDPEILSGTPVVRGTRVPAYDIAASVSAGIPMDKILAEYPSVKREQVELAALYAEANPLRGRPRQRLKLPPGTKIISRTTHRLKNQDDETAH